ncbi:MAG TPA: CoA transferase [Dehalococcoidia bacterium]|nr:CoA transferase [Dehalococcoidia bacterium]
MPETEGGPLAGVRVLDFTRYQQGPYATSLLADLGADVLKVEPRLDGELGRQMERDAEGFSAYFETYNRGKRSITLDLRRPEAREIVHRLVPHMDGLAENFRPGVMERLGCGYEALRPLNPRLIYAAASAFGPRGPERERPGYDHIAQAVSGLMVEQAGGPGHEPPQPALPGAADEISAMLFALGIVSALYARQQTGMGQKVEVSLFGSMLAFQGRQLMRYLRTGKQGRARWRRSPTYSHYRCADGWLAIAAVDPKMWPRLCRALGKPDLEHDPRFAGPWDRDRNAAGLEELLEAIFATRAVADWLARLITEDVPCGPVNDYRAVEASEQALANGYLTTIEHPNLGTLRSAGIPIHLSATPPPPLRSAPELGMDTETVLLDLGYDWPQIEALRRAEVI